MKLNFGLKLIIAMAAMSTINAIATTSTGKSMAQAVMPIPTIDLAASVRVMPSVHDHLPLFEELEVLAQKVESELAKLKLFAQKVESELTKLKLEYEVAALSTNTTSHCPIEPGDSIVVKWDGATSGSLPEWEGITGQIDKVKGLYFFEVETRQKSPWYLTPSITFPILLVVAGLLSWPSLAGGAISDSIASTTDKLDEIIAMSVSMSVDMIWVNSDAIQV
jgi:hypothetical protein